MPIPTPALPPPEAPPVPTLTAPVESPAQTLAAMERRTMALFRAMSTDYLLREQFVTDPAKMMAEYLHTASLPADVAALSNHMLYAIFANPDLLQWLHNYALTYGGKVVPYAQFLEAFAQAALSAHDNNSVLALLRSGMAPSGRQGLENFEQNCVALLGILRSPAVSITGDSLAGNRSITGDSITGDSVSGDIGTTSATGTTRATGATGDTGTTDDVGGMLHYPFAVASDARSTLDALVQYASHLSSIGALTFTGIQPAPSSSPR